MPREFALFHRAGAETERPPHPFAEQRDKLGMLANDKYIRHEDQNDSTDREFWP